MGAVLSRLAILPAFSVLATRPAMLPGQARFIAIRGRKNVDFLTNNLVQIAQDSDKDKPL
jgi:hypothetical protein